MRVAGESTDDEHRQWSPSCPPGLTTPQTRRFQSCHSPSPLRHDSDEGETRRRPTGNLASELAAVMGLASVRSKTDQPCEGFDHVTGSPCLQSPITTDALHSGTSGTSLPWTPRQPFETPPVLTLATRDLRSTARTYRSEYSGDDWGSPVAPRRSGLGLLLDDRQINAEAAGDELFTISAIWRDLSRASAALSPMLGAMPTSLSHQWYIGPSSNMTTSDESGLSSLLKDHLGPPCERSVVASHHGTSQQEQEAIELGLTRLICTNTSATARREAACDTLRHELSILRAHQLQGRALRVRAAENEGEALLESIDELLEEVRAAAPSAAVSPDFHTRPLSNLGAQLVFLRQETTDAAKHLSNVSDSLQSQRRLLVRAEEMLRASTVLTNDLVREYDLIARLCEVEGIEEPQLHVATRLF
ncbi:hypothetical protein PYCC9005_003822 [Savitreella phatthalungensis]